MNQTTHFTDPNAIEARVSVQLPGTVSPNDAPSEIMWMPPGRHTITASRAGKPVTLDVNVTENGARRVAAQLSEYIAAAQRGIGDHPYYDFNHDDKEASAHPKSFRWGGDDPLQGGIRSPVDWTGTGKQAVLGKDYRRFSPSFYVDKSGEITGIPVNCGGLVNRAAFQRIAPVMSKSAETAAMLVATDFLSQAKVLARSRNIDLGQASEVLARKNPYLYECYRYEVLGLGTKPQPRQETVYQARARRAENDEFMIRASALSDSLDIDMTKAIGDLARSQPALYERYRANLGLGDSREYRQTIAAVQARVEESEFFVLSKRIAAEKSIDLVDAFSIAARQRPDLYDQYHASL